MSKPTRTKDRLYAPGPVEVPPAVLEALARPVLHHRTPAFRELFARTRARLAELARVPDDDVVIVTGSGTAAFEGAFLACVPRGARVAAIDAGKFGQRWAKLARHFGCDVHVLELAWGDVADPQAVGAWLEELTGSGPVDAVLTTHSETSTGALHDVAGIARVARAAAPDALVLVDCVTSLGVAPVEPHAWGIDAMVSGSQKGLMTPPGLGFAWLSERAWASTDRLHPTFYLDLRKERRQQRDNQTAYTPAVSLVAALEVALTLLLDEGLEEVWERRARLNDAVLAAGASLGCEPYARRPSPAVAAMRAPEGIDAPAIVRGLAARGMRIAGGQDHAKPVLFRPSLMGHADRYDAVALAGALEETMRELGRDVPNGTAVAEALRVLAE